MPRLPDTALDPIFDSSVLDPFQHHASRVRAAEMDEHWALSEDTLGSRHDQQQNDTCPNPQSFVHGRR